MFKQHSFPHIIILFWLPLLLAALACGAFGAGRDNTPTPLSLDPTPVATAVPTIETVISDEEAEQQSLDATLSEAVNRATTMMAQNAKPTPPPSGGLGGKESDGSTASVPPTLLPPTAAPQRGNTGLQINNSSSTTACFVYISLPTDETWGADQLGESEVIASGGNRVFEVPAAAYDLRIDDCHGKIIHTEFDMLVDELRPVQVVDTPLPSGGNAPLTILNDFPDATVCYLFLSPSTSDTWGRDWLGAGQVIAGSGRTVIQVSEDVYDLKASDCDLEPIAEIYTVKVGQQGYIWTLSGTTGQATLELVNNGQPTVCYVQISLSTADTWGADWLGGEEVIGSGRSRQFEMIPDVYDIRALDCNQDTLKEEYNMSMQGVIRWIVP